jgi:hypothetical protein
MREDDLYDSKIQSGPDGGDRIYNNYSQEKILALLSLLFPKRAFDD